MLDTKRIDWQEVEEAVENVNAAMDTTSAKVTLKNFSGAVYSVGENVIRIDLKKK